MSRDTVFYNTAQHLTKVLAPLGKTADSYISDSTDFCEKLKTVENPGKIVSYDVVDLFTSVPINETLHILRNRLDNLDSPLDTKLSTDSILQLITNSITSTYFTWGDELYEQIHGLPMGSPLSPILSEIYMTSFEHQALSSSLIKPTCWFRKVDDTFAILPQANDPSALLQHLNQQHPRIQFTFETESNSQLPFLDVLVTRTTDNTIQTSVYRKPTHTDQYLHFDSNHSLRTKTGIISTLTRRALNLSSVSPQPELNHLKHVFTQLNNYPPQLVNRVINSTVNPPPKPTTTKPDPAPIRISLPYTGKTSHHISRLLKQQAADQITRTADDVTTTADDVTTTADDVTTTADDATTTADDVTTIADNVTTTADDATTSTTIA
ncbi:uncharacterized protein [Haliotis asinina]|uniref:uncharacterized protein n=1 Tax=Haliotis asinina TaxID=109174 RepID=UPI003531EC72